jgi:hypothetical protein
MRLELFPEVLKSKTATLDVYTKSAKKAYRAWIGLGPLRDRRFRLELSMTSM